MKKFLEEFKAFALKGNMMDMAIGVLIGGAFSTLVTSLTDNIINPIIGILFQTDFSDVVLHLPFDINLASVHSSLPSLTLSFWHSFCSVC